MSATGSLLDARRSAGLCAMCGAPLTEKEKALEGVGGSYVRCDKCVREVQSGATCPTHGPVSAVLWNEKLVCPDPECHRTCDLRV